MDSAFKEQQQSASNTIKSKRKLLYSAHPPSLPPSFLLFLPPFLKCMLFLFSSLSLSVFLLLLSFFSDKLSPVSECPPFAIDAGLQARIARLASENESKDKVISSLKGSSRAKTVRYKLLLPSLLLLLLLLRYGT